MSREGFYSEVFVGSLVGAWTCPLSIREASIELNLITYAPGKAFRLPNCSSAPSERRSRGPLNHRNDGPNRVFPTTFCCCPWVYPCFLETKRSHPTANSGTPSSWQVLIKASKSVMIPCFVDSILSSVQVWLISLVSHMKCPF